MLNKQKIARVSFFLIVACTLSINLLEFGYVKYRDSYFYQHNWWAASDFKDYRKNNEVSEADIKSVCAKFKPESFISRYYTLDKYSSLLILISIALFFTLLAYDKTTKNKIFYDKDKYIISTAIFFSLIAFYQTSTIEPDFTYFGFDCARWL